MDAPLPAASLAQQAAVCTLEQAQVIFLGLKGQLAEVNSDVATAQECVDNAELALEQAARHAKESKLMLSEVQAKLDSVTTTMEELGSCFGYSEEAREYLTANESVFGRFPTPSGSEPSDINRSYWEGPRRKSMDASELALYAIKWKQESPTMEQLRAYDEDLFGGDTPRMAKSESEERSPVDDGHSAMAVDAQGPAYPHRVVSIASPAARASLAAATTRRMAKPKERGSVKLAVAKANPNYGLPMARGSMPAAKPPSTRGPPGRLGVHSFTEAPWSNSRPSMVRDPPTSKASQVGQFESWSSEYVAKRE